MKRRGCLMILSGFLALVIALAFYILIGVQRSTKLESTQYSISLESPWGVATHLRVAHLSDLHRAEFGENNDDLIALVASKTPDIILCTGDMIDVHTEDPTAFLAFTKRLTDIAPVFFSLGNHEAARQDVRLLMRQLTQQGVMVLSRSTATIEINGLSLTVGGLSSGDWFWGEERIDILLCHYPGRFFDVAAMEIPLVFCGHTHGGQFRIPLLDIALYAPGEGFFPKYTAGLYKAYHTIMVVSRGLGNSSFPLRMYNPPEVVVVDIEYGVL